VWRMSWMRLWRRCRSCRWGGRGTWSGSGGRLSMRLWSRSWRWCGRSGNRDHDLCSVCALRTTRIGDGESCCIITRRIVGVGNSRRGLRHRSRAITEIKRVGRDRVPSVRVIGARAVEIDSQRRSARSRCCRQNCGRCRVRRWTDCPAWAIAHVGSAIHRSSEG